MPQDLPLEEIQSKLLAAIRDGTSEITELATDRGQAFLALVSASVTDSIVSGEAWDKRYAKSRVMIANLRSSAKLEESILARVTDVVNIGGAFASTFLGLNVARIIGSITGGEA